ncbi:MAG: EamA family transporter [Saprospiraceae bacterium]
MSTLVKPQDVSLAPWRAWAILAFLSLIWGTSYLLIKRGLVFFAPHEVASLRLGVAALAFSPIIVQEVRKVQPRQLPLLLVLG